MLNYLLIRVGQFLALYLPLKVCYCIAILISDLRYLVAAEDRMLVKANLTAIFPDKTEQEINKIRIKMFRNFAKYLVDFFRFSKLDKEYIKNNIKIENIRFVDEALAKGKGAIILTAHLGNWELGGVVMSQLGYPFWAVALPHKYKKLNEFFNKQRDIKGVKVIPFGNAVKQSLTVLKENKVLALAGDRDFTKERGIIVDFLQRRSYLPKGPAAFSLKTGSIIVPGFMLRNADDSFTLRFERPIECSATSKQITNKTNDQELIPLVYQYKKVIEDYIKKYPDQWYMFRQYWI